MNIEKLVADQEMNGEGIYQKDIILSELEVKYVNKYRTILLYEEVTRSSICKCLYWLDKIVSLDAKTGVKKPITIRIDSYGGHVYHGLSLISRIESLVEDGYEIVGICTGVAMSMGSAILNACSKRLMYKYGTIMIHQVNSGVYGKYQDMKEELEETKRLNTLLMEMYMKRTKLKEEDITNIIEKKKDLYLNAETSLKYGIVDGII